MYFNLEYHRLVLTKAYETATKVVYHGQDFV